MIQPSSSYIKRHYAQFNQRGDNPHPLSASIAPAALSGTWNSRPHFGHLTYSQLSEESILLQFWQDTALAYRMLKRKPQFGQVMVFRLLLDNNISSTDLISSNFSVIELL